jgi:hypothetical protein
MKRRKTLLVVLGIAMAAMLWQLYPDLVRYIKISRM